MKTIDIKPIHKMNRDSLGDIENGYIVERGSLCFGVFVSKKLIPFTEKIVFSSMFKDKLRIDYPNTSFRKYEQASKRVKSLIDVYIAP